MSDAAVLVEVHANPDTLSDADLLAHLKATLPQTDRTALYSQYVKARHLKPALDSKDFLALYDSVTPRKAVRIETRAFAATHTDTQLGLPVQVTEDAEGWSLLWECGMQGHYGKRHPEWFTNRFLPMEGGAA